MDQLSDQDDGRSLRWLPTSLPKNVHIVVSTLPNTGGCLAVLKTKLKPESNTDFYLEVHYVSPFLLCRSLLNQKYEQVIKKRTKAWSAREVFSYAITFCHIEANKPDQLTNFPRLHMQIEIILWTRVKFFLSYFQQSDRLFMK